MRHRQPFREKGLTPQQQLETLSARGLHIEDSQRARRHLEHINYHRLLPYWEGLLKGDGRFEPGSTFESVLRRYTFDRKLRLLMLDAIERLEVSIRSRWSNHMAVRHGPLCLAEAELFQDRRVHQRSYESLLHFYAGNEDEFVVRFRERYERGQIPPIWICSEMLTLGQLAHWLGNLRDPRDLHAVSFAYQLERECFLSFLQHLTEVRNLAAHHSRLFNRKLPAFVLPAQVLENAEEGSIYNTIVMLDFLLSIISPGHSWTRRLAHSLKRHPDLPEEMGFPPGWHARPPFAESV
ncbi:MAG: Abi family protein [Candidatus Eremiobacteraeota bacterium]|nr:Abi family protein [Candidatus Eremiobacteraeota bacterium]